MKADLDLSLNRGTLNSCEDDQCHSIVESTIVVKVYSKLGEESITEIRESNIPSDKFKTQRL